MNGGLPPTIMVWCVLLILSTLLFNQYPEYKKVLHLHWKAALKQGQYHRLLTNFLCFGGKFDMGCMMQLFFLAQSGARVEQGRSMRFILMLIIGAAGLLYVDYYKMLLAARQPWLSHRLIYAIVCLESWDNPFQLTTLPPLPLPPFPAWLLPPLLSLQSCLMFGNDWRTLVAPLVVSIGIHLAITILALLFPCLDHYYVGAMQFGGDWGTGTGTGTGT
eukprot:CAMPEP_0177720566 /NCGR_PEP_ID=MMETSP0484_2-20121128/16686_1 /TAXON_ID=354590 /ORGANISM="Rhodomonas lens, Strain RHODO" /LENGTH=217 /DNA_ID=CAMNT_0019232821 /DNA_START=108 /DNA_END=758 /DNA_ORIENTATION=-